MQMKQPNRSDAPGETLRDPRTNVYFIGVDGGGTRASATAIDAAAQLALRKHQAGNNPL